MIRVRIFNLPGVYAAAFVSACVCYFICAFSSQAEFILSSSLNFHASSPRGGASAGVTILPAIEGSKSPAGLIFYAMDIAIPAQSFNPSVLKTGNSESCFLEYSSEKRAYTRLVLPNGKEYKVEGNVTFRLRQLRIALSVENPSPYVSVVDEGDEVSVLGLLNNQFVAKGSGSRMANWMDAGIRNSVETFEVKGTDLLLQGISFKDSKIGLPVQGEQKGICASPQAVVVSESQVSEYLRGRTSEEMRRQISAIQQGQSSDALSRYTVLNVLTSGIVVLDGYGKPLVIQEESQRIREGREGDIILCSVKDLPN